METKPIRQVQEEIVDEFSVFDNWMDKYNYLIELSRDLPAIDAKHKTEEHLIKGCQSKVWLRAEWDNGKIHFTADSDAIITRGLIALLIRVFSNRTPEEIMEADLEFIDQIGLRENLSPTRSNGLLAMLKQMKLYAVAFDAAKNKE
ncbi:MAG TPA: SufE family protein [Bacteroidetes bacterium]|nr:SufE family protein [Bacteroidota bacterium]